MAKPNKGHFQKGHKLSKGRPPVILPEVQAAIDQNKNALKIMILEEMNKLEQNVPRIRLAIQQILERSINDGDAVKLKILLEIALGKIVEEPPEFPVSDTEKEIIITYRKRLAEQAQPIPDSSSDD